MGRLVVGVSADVAMQFEWEDEPQPRAVRLVSESARVDDPVRVTVAGVEVEGRIEAVESSMLRVRVRRLRAATCPLVCPRADNRLLRCGPQ